MNKKIITTLGVVGILGVGAVGGALLTGSAQAEPATYETKGGEVLKGTKVPIDIDQVKRDLSDNQRNRSDVEIGCQAQLKDFDDKIASGQQDIDAYTQLKPASADTPVEDTLPVTP